MAQNNKIADYITFPTTFETYRWYKPILVMIISFIAMFILIGITTLAYSTIFGQGFIINVFRGGIESLSNSNNIFFADLIIIMFIPALYIASRIVKDRPFSSYSSSRGGWNFKLYFKALVIPIILFVAYGLINAFISGSKGTANISIGFILVLLISIPLQSIAEEYLFRGLILQTLGSWFKIPVLAIILQAIIFAIVHGYNNAGFIEMLVSGLICGFFAWKTNGIEVSSAIHTANNFSVGLLVMLGLHTSTSNPQLSSVLGVIAFEIILFIILYYVGKKTDWFGEIPENSEKL